MKRNLMKFFIVLSIAILFGNGFAWAGGRNYPSHRPNEYHYRGYQDKGEGRWHGQDWRGHRHYRQHYDHGPRYRYYPRYCPPERHYYYYNQYYPGYWGRYDGAYYFSGGYSEPGVGFVFGTRGNW